MGSGVIPVYGANGIIGYTDQVTHRQPVILVGCRGSIGSVHKTRGEIYATSNAMALDELREERVSTDYLAHFLRARGLADVTSGSSQPQLTQSSLGRVLVPLPALLEQHRIASILDKADALRAKRREQLAHLDALPQAIFRQLLSEAGNRLLTHELGDLVSFKSGQFLPAKAQAGGEVAVYGGNGINGYHDVAMFHDPQVIVGRVGAYCGVVHITHGPVWVTDNALILTPTSGELELGYLSIALEAANLNQYKSQSGQPLVSGNRLSTVPIPVPTPLEQRRFVARIEVLSSIRRRLERALAEADALFASLQSRAFRGEL